jgi:hypothetical protein
MARGWSSILRLKLSRSTRSSATPGCWIEGCQIVGYKGTAQGAVFDELLKSAEALAANAILNTCYDRALDVGTLFHGAAVIIEPIPVPPPHLPGGIVVSYQLHQLKGTDDAKRGDWAPQRLR